MWAYGIEGNSYWENFSVGDLSFVLCVHIIKINNQNSYEIEQMRTINDNQTSNVKFFVVVGEIRSTMSPALAFVPKCV